jgi:hypothetical protein
MSLKYSPCVLATTGDPELTLVLYVQILRLHLKIRVVLALELWFGPVWTT